MQAENDCLRQELKEAHEALASACTPPGVHDYERRRWALGMRCLGSLAMVAPFLAMMTLCENRAVRRSAWHSAVASGSAYAHPATLTRGGCRMAAPAMGFERFTQALERPARVSESSDATLSADTACTVRIAPVSMVEFNCHVEVVCGGHTVYGALPTGYAHCDVDQSRVTRAFDPDVTSRDGDAAITADLESGRVLIQDGAGRSASRVLLTLDRPPLTR